MPLHILRTKNMNYKIKEDAPANIFDAVVERIELFAYRDKGPGDGVGWSGSYSSMITTRLSTLDHYIANYCVEDFKKRHAEKIKELQNV